MQPCRKHLAHVGSIFLQLASKQEEISTPSSDEIMPTPNNDANLYGNERVMRRTSTKPKIILSYFK